MTTFGFDQETVQKFFRKLCDQEWEETLQALLEDRPSMTWFQRETKKCRFKQEFMRSPLNFFPQWDDIIVGVA